MGFRCPVCLKDFGIDKEERDKHCDVEHQGIGKDIINLVAKEAEPDTN